MTTDTTAARRDRYRFSIDVGGQRLAAGDGYSEAFVIDEGMRYLWQYAEEGEATLRVKHGRKTLFTAQMRRTSGVVA